MCHKGTLWFSLALLGFTAALAAQQPAGLEMEWRRIGNTVFDASLAGPATGPVERVWYGAGGDRLFLRTASGRVYETGDFENWQESQAQPPVPDAAAMATSLPEVGVRVRPVRTQDGRLYAAGNNAFRSEDGGLHWTNLTAYRNQSILGTGLNDLAVSPADPDEVVVAGMYGVWRSLDGGATWNGLNQSLPNLPVKRFIAVPSGARGVRLQLAVGNRVLEWTPGERAAWRTPEPVPPLEDAALRERWSRALGIPVEVAVAVGDFVYAGTVDGALYASPDRGAAWRQFTLPGAGPVKAIYADPADPRTALAAMGPRPDGQRGPAVAKTTNGGVFWDDLTANLPPGGVAGIAGDRATGAVYAATRDGVYLSYADLAGAGRDAQWTRLAGGLPDAPAADVRLDEAGNQLYIALDGYGVYAAMAPHRRRDPRLVSAADWSSRPAAPGSLVSVLGASARSVRAGDIEFPVLSRNGAESQVQTPFQAPTGSTLTLSIDAEGSPRRTFGLPVREASPVIFVDRDGAPLLLDGDSGVLLDAMTPARSNGRLQILATGLGRVTPEWPTGLAAPLESPPKVNAPVRVLLDREPLEVTRATLAPGYIGFYLVEVQLPAIVNSGPAELFLEAGGVQSNRVRVYLVP